MLYKKNKSVVFLDQLAALPVDEVIIHSLEGGMYIASVVLGLHTLRVYEMPDKPLCRRKMSEMRCLLEPAGCDNVFLVQASAFDEMIGSQGEVANTLRISLAPLRASVA